MCDLPLERFVGFLLLNWTWLLGWRSNALEDIDDPIEEMLSNNAPLNKNDSVLSPHAQYYQLMIWNTEMLLITILCKVSICHECSHCYSFVIKFQLVFVNINRMFPSPIVSLHGLFHLPAKTNCLWLFSGLFVFPSIAFIMRVPELYVVAQLGLKKMTNTVVC